MHTGVARMRDHKGVVKAAHQRMIGLEDSVGVDAAELFVKLIFLNAVVMIKPCLRAPADVKGGIDVFVRPVHDLAQLVPVIDLLKGNLLHRRTGDDQPVEVVVFYLVKGLVEGRQMVRRGVFGGMGRHLQYN